MGIFRTKFYPLSEKNLPEKSVSPESTKLSVNKIKVIKDQYKFNKRVNFPSGTITTPNMIHRVLTKMGYGANDESVGHVQSLPGATDTDKIFAYIDEQLDPMSIDDSVAESQLNNGYETLNKTRIQLYQDHYRRPDGVDIPWEVHVRPGRETNYASYMRATQSKRQLLEILVDFWHNHFNVYMDSGGVQPMFVHYDREVIRANALGSFRQMLEDVTTSTCMLDYLGNGVNDKDAPNENYARELLELHTLSAKNYFGHMAPEDVPVDGQGRKIGYVEADVLEMARVLTGWSYSGADWWDYQNGNVSTGEFLYRDEWHDKDPKVILGQTFNFDQNNPLSDVRSVLDMLAEHPATAEFLASKLCKRFISDNPPQLIIDAVANTLHQNWQAPDQIKQAMETLLKSNEFLNTWGEKIKRPFERIASSMRQIGVTFDFSPNHEYSSWMFWSLDTTGQNLFYWTSPNGYPDTKMSWLGASNTMATWRFMQWFTRLRDDNNGDIPFNDILNITNTAIPESNNHTANNLMNFWFEKACGHPPSVEVQDKLAHFMSYSNYTEPGWAPTDRNTPIDLSTNDWPSYNQERLYAMVSSIFLTSEFLYR